MMKYGKKIIAVAALSVAALAFAPVAMAANKKVDDDGTPRLGLFFGPQVGVSFHDGEGGGSGSAVGEIGDTDQVTWGLSAWFRPNNWGAVSLGYIDLGDDLNGFHPTLMPMIPLNVNGLSLFGTFGLLVEAGKGGDDRDTWMSYGGGILWDDLSIGDVNNLGLRLEYERFDERNHSDNIVNAVTLSFFYQFGNHGGR